MSTVTPITSRLSPEEVVDHLNAAIDKLAVGNLEYRDENEMLRSWCASLMKRYTAVRVRQMRLVIAGALIGGTLAYVVDGEWARKFESAWPIVDRALRVVGL